jgi:hypothetical protein
MTPRGGEQTAQAAAVARLDPKPTPRNSTFRAAGLRRRFATIALGFSITVLQRLRAGTPQQRAERLGALFAFYRDNPIQFVIDWGCTFDPRLAAEKKPAVLPFMLFPRQIEWMQWVLDMLETRTPAINEKSRDVGASWLAVSLSASLCLFRDNFTVGFGSRKEEYVDKLDSPKALFYKIRMFLRLVPPEFRRGWDGANTRRTCASSSRANGSVITGEAGDNIGRGDRTSMYFVDEAAHLERPELVEASLSATTNCRIDMSSVNGTSNPFAVKRHSFPARQVFTFHWRDDPRKDEAWYEKQKLNLPPSWSPRKSTFPTRRPLRASSYRKSGSKPPSTRTKTRLRATGAASGARSTWRTRASTSTRLPRPTASSCITPRHGAARAPTFTAR